MVPPGNLPGLRDSGCMGDRSKEREGTRQISKGLPNAAIGRNLERDSRFEIPNRVPSRISNLESGILPSRAGRGDPTDEASREMTRTAASRGHASPPINNRAESSPSPAGPATADPAGHTHRVAPQGPAHRIADPVTVRRGVPRRASRP